MPYYDEYVSIDADDQTIACHPLIDACNGSIAYRMLENLGIPCIGKTVLDVGAGTGQVSRFLKGIPGLCVEACDVDPQSRAFFQSHPELKDVRFRQMDFLVDSFPRDYDAMVCRGAFHHVPKSKRPLFLKAMCDHAGVVIIADEGILEYETEQERVRSCQTWYGYVISEARRRRLDRLAEMETRFLEHERLATADDAGDFKESPSHLEGDASEAGVHVLSVDRQGPWRELGGGFFTVVLSKRPNSERRP